MENTEQGRDDGGGRVEVNLLGQRLMLKGVADPQHIERLTAYVRAKLDDAAQSGPVPATKLAVLVALNIADDLFRVTDEAQAFRREVASRSRGLLSELDGHLP